MRFVACVVLCCAQGCAASSDADAGSARDAGMDGAGAEHQDGTVEYQCVFVPPFATPPSMVIRDDIARCLEGNQGVDGGVVYEYPTFLVADGGGCPDLECFPGFGIWFDDGAIPVTTLPACCGNGPPCACNEFCWAPDIMTAPHCIPIPPDAGPDA
jgi:hypothetical protein